MCSQRPVYDLMLELILSHQGQPVGKGWCKANKIPEGQDDEAVPESLPSSSFLKPVMMEIL